jgi:DHA1 family bicyclomycin/chloramphenicol resistance-like MFS transporter
MSTPANPAGADRPVMGFTQFVVFVAAMMATNALAIDTMLPALPVIGRALGIAADNERQWIVTAYLLGFGAAQIVYGTLADRFGRRPVLLAALGIYAVFSAVAGFAGSFDVMVAARVLQGIGAAGTRVLAVSIIRDRYAGRQMARVMSLSFIVFLAVPIAAPSLGQLMMRFAPWQAIFFGLSIFAAAVMVWATLRLPETLHAEDRLPIAATRVAAAFRVALSQRKAVGYMLAMTVMLGGLFGYINSVQQVFFEVFHAPALFPLIFGLSAVFMAASSLLNARIVGRLGTHRVSHSALLAYVAVAAVHALLAWSGRETLPIFTVCQALMMFSFGLVVSNFGAMAMEPLGHIAGTASSVQGFVTTVGGALLGFLIGQQFDGSAIPMTLGFVGFGAAAQAIVCVTERGRLFRGAHEDGVVAGPALAVPAP